MLCFQKLCKWMQRPTMDMINASKISATQSSDSSARCHYIPWSRKPFCDDNNRVLHKTHKPKLQKNLLQRVASPFPSGKHDIPLLSFRKNTTQSKNSTTKNTIPSNNQTKNKDSVSKDWLPSQKKVFACRPRKNRSVSDRKIKHFLTGTSKLAPIKEENIPKDKTSEQAFSVNGAETEETSRFTKFRNVTIKRISSQKVELAIDKNDKQPQSNDDLLDDILVKLVKDGKSLEITDRERFRLVNELIPSYRLQLLIQILKGHWCMSLLLISLFVLLLALLFGYGFSAALSPSTTTTAMVETMAKTSRTNTETSTAKSRSFMPLNGTFQVLQHPSKLNVANLAKYFVVKPNEL